MNYRICTVSGTAADLQLYNEVAELTGAIKKTYPEYGKWLKEKFFPGLKDGSRKLIIAKDETGRLAGAILLKNTAEEKKICSLFVRKECRGLGIAGKLMQESFKVLRTDRPLLSVADKIIRRYKSSSTCTILNFLTEKEAHIQQKIQNTILTTKLRKY